MWPMRSRKSPRARGTPGVQRTHGLRCLATPKRNGDLGRGRRPVLVKPQVRLLSSVPRAVFIGFPPHGPRWLSGFYPPLWTLAAPGRLARSYGAAAKEPGDANCGAGTDAAPAAARWVCVLHPCAATALRSRLTTPHEAPSDGPACGQPR